MGAVPSAARDVTLVDARSGIRVVRDCANPAPLHVSRPGNQEPARLARLGTSRILAFPNVAFSAKSETRLFFVACVVGHTGFPSPEWSAVGRSALHDPARYFISPLRSLAPLRSHPRHPTIS